MSTTVCFLSVHQLIKPVISLDFMKVRWNKILEHRLSCVQIAKIVTLSQDSYSYILSLCY